MKTIQYILIVGMIAALLAGCDKMNDINQEYIDRGETIYTGIVDSIQALPGNNRVWFSWFINADPRITKTVIYWNDEADSAIIPVSRTVNELTKMETIIPCDEGSFVFRFVTKDDEGHFSVVKSSTEALVSVYGERYISALTNRIILTLSASKITWALPESAAVQYTRVSYSGTTGVIYNIRVENDEDSTTLTNAASGTVVTVVTVFKPVGGLDEVEASPRYYTIP